MSPTGPNGSAALHFPRLALGTAPLASQFWGNEETRAIATANAALRAGITWVDTAPLYGSGEAEQRLGRALEQVEGDFPTVATKVGRPAIDGPDGRDSMFDFSREATRRSLHDSLQRLGIDRVDVVHVHDPEDHIGQALDECLPTLVAMRDEGLLTAISVGTMHCGAALRLLTEADLDIVMVSSRLTLLDSSALDELVPACAQRGVPVLAAAVFNSGLLARPVAGSWFNYAPADAALVARAGGMADVCAAAGISLKAAAMQYPLRHDGVRTVVVGMASEAEVAENVALMDQQIPDEVWAELARC
jgi:D-threo-aldose 1-dehydrogenase